MDGMNPKPNDGGPAFPFRYDNTNKVTVTLCDVEIPPGKFMQFAGMTLRQYYAGQAMAGMLAADAPDYQYHNDKKGLAINAIAAADALIAELEKEKE